MTSSIFRKKGEVGGHSHTYSHTLCRVQKQYIAWISFFFCLLHLSTFPRAYNGLEKRTKEEIKESLCFFFLFFAFAAHFLAFFWVTSKVSSFLPSPTENGGGGGMNANCRFFEIFLRLLTSGRKKISRTPHNTPPTTYCFTRYHVANEEGQT